MLSRNIGLIIFFSLLMACVMAMAGCAASSTKTDGLVSGAKQAFQECVSVRGVALRADGQVLCISGPVNPSMFLGAARLRAAIRPHPYVVLQSYGGREDSALALVHLLEAYDPVPVVGAECASACAQILFLMGSKRIMLHCADIAIHGGKDIFDSVEAIVAKDVSDEVKQTMLVARERFMRFYRDRGISMDMVTKPPADVQRRLDAGEIVFWPWTISQLRAFGVQGIISQRNPVEVVPPDYAEVCLSSVNKKASTRDATVPDGAQSERSHG